MFETNEHYDLSTACDINIGDNIATAHTKYGTPDRMFTFSNATYHVFKDRKFPYRSGMFFKVDATDRITGWVVFSVFRSSRY